MRDNSSDNPSEDDVQALEDEVARLEASGLKQARTTKLLRVIFGGLVALVALFFIVSTFSDDSSDEKTKSSQTSSRCRVAVADAAAVPAGDDANSELFATADACSTASEWWREIQAAPGAFGMMTLAGEDRVVYIESLCSAVPSKAMCRDAKASGLSRY